MVVKVKLLLFARARELAGKSVDTLILPDALSCHNLLEIIVKQYSLQQIKSNILISVNQDLCHIEDHLSLSEGDEVAIIPPLSGG
ncbi:molybdopterin synthase sulfur carrier subunit [Euwallacea similis]|uniref:molybdopterin synthase sulfur carrier subunit n=1 Tax=Euwallacea similis TaxID=1736056 RepID=UPI003450938A